MGVGHGKYTYSNSICICDIVVLFLVCRLAVVYEVVAIVTFSYDLALLISK